MLRPTARLTFLCVGLALATAASLSSVPARAATASPARVIDLTYDVYLGGLHIFTFDVDMTLQPDQYRVTAEGGTRGTVGWLYKWDMKLAAEGLDQNGRIEPRRYVAETDWQSNQRTVHLGFAEGGRYDLQQTPPPEPDPDIEGGLPETLPDGIVDPLSLAVAASRTLKENGHCSQTVPVFDGRRRFDLVMQHVDEAMLPPSEYSIYQGPAVRCSFSMKRISGFRKSWRSGRQWDDDSSAPPTIWVASIQQDLPPVPVRYDGAIRLGRIVVHLTNAQVRTEPANAMPDERASQQRAR
ncbi:DUF3108 domain-containing protein [Dongia deserti]|uniref:DUF3108 domain-containing protein n=1 Tax=Dongia deserti TaxID=2268030 RepID=UPI000E64BF10|nr:DUF3108 domain-containing protein [Dongia deserti]